MFTKFKTFTLNVIAGANVGVILLMLLIGFSGHVDPTRHSAIATVGLSFPLPLFLNFAFLVFWCIVRLRYALIPIIGFLVGFVPVRTYFPLNAPFSPPDDAIKVISYNVESFGASALAGDTTHRDINPIVEYLRDSHADIICLQEAVPHSTIADSVLKKIYPYTSFKQRTDKGSDLLAVYSQYPIRRTEQINYSSEHNISFAYELDVKGRKVLLVNNHLESNRLVGEDRDQFNNMIKGRTDYKNVKDDSRHLLSKLAAAGKIRAAQVDAVVRYISSHRGGKSVICVGDFNEQPISYSHIRFADRLTDCYVASGNGPGWSYNKSHMYVRIDNIFCSDDLHPYRCHIDRSIRTSDHYPIVCWLSWK